MITRSPETALIEDTGMRYKINQMCCAVICVWMSLPYFKSRVGLKIMAFFFGLWFITTDLRWLTSKYTKDLYAIIIFFATFIPYILTGNLKYGMNGPGIVYSIFPLFFFGMFINYYYMYYKKDYNSLGKIALVSTIMYSVGALQTVVGLMRYPGASRGLANAGVDVALKNAYARVGIGGYGFIYAAMFLLIVVVYPLLTKSKLVEKKYKIISVLALFSLALVIFRASFTIAIVLGFLGLISVVFVKNQRTLVLFLAFSALFVFIMPQTLLAGFFVKSAEIFKNSNVVKARLLDMANNLYLGTLEEGLTGNRLSKYIESTATFLRYPLFGMYGPFGNLDATLGGHSGWIDQLAFYGLFTGIPLMATLYYNIKKHLQFFKNSKYLGYMSVSSFLFIFLGLVNPTITVYNIGFIFFCVIPVIPFMPYAFIPNSALPEKLDF